MAATPIIATWLKLAGEALKVATKFANDRSAAKAQAHRNELARDVAKLITGHILSGYARTYPHLRNLITEFEGLLARGAELPRDERTLVLDLIEKAQVAADAGHGTKGLATYVGQRPASSRKWAAKKSPAKRPVAKKSAAKRPAAKKATRKSAAKKASAKKST